MLDWLQIKDYKMKKENNSLNHGKLLLKLCNFVLNVGLYHLHDTMLIVMNTTVTELDFLFEPQELYNIYNAMNNICNVSRIASISISLSVLDFHRQHVYKKPLDVLFQEEYNLNQNTKAKTKKEVCAYNIDFARISTYSSISILSMLELYVPMQYHHSLKNVPVMKHLLCSVLV